MDGTEEPAFWCLGALVEDVLPGYYGNTMLASAVDQAVLRTFVDSRFPRVGAALDDAGVPLAAVTGSWFLTLYVNHLPWETALRVWDVLLFERTRRVLFKPLSRSSTSTPSASWRRGGATG